MTRQRRSARPAAAKRPPTAAKIPATKIPAHPAPDDPAHEEWRVDEADDESFPASDPSAAAQPHRSPPKK
jgi:hypothetical protein